MDNKHRLKTMLPKEKGCLEDDFPCLKGRSFK